MGTGAAVNGDKRDDCFGFLDLLVSIGRAAPDFYLELRDVRPITISFASDAAGATSGAIKDVCRIATVPS
jgi:hypothetical protein